MELKPHYKILIPGYYFCDIIFTGLPNLPRLGTEMYADQIDIVPGGGALSTSVALHRLGVSVGWVSRLGNDFFSSYIRQFLEAGGIDLSLVTQMQTPLQRVTVALSYPQDRAFVSYVDPTPNNVDLALEAIDRVSFEHLHFTGLAVDTRVPSLIEHCHKRGITVSMDCQHREDTLEMPLVKDILSRLDIFMPNAIEAQRITRTEVLDEALERLSAIVPFIVIKCGAQGALARRGGIDTKAAAMVSSVIDTTGAGDVFNAGFLAAFIQKQNTLECLRWGNFCAGMSVRGVGSMSTAPTKQQLTEWLQTSAIL